MFSCEFCDVLSTPVRQNTCKGMLFCCFAEPGHVHQRDIRFLPGQEEEWFGTGRNDVTAKLKDGLLDTRRRWPNPVPYQIESSLCKLF